VGINYEALEEEYDDLPIVEKRPKERPQGSLTNLGVYLENRAKGGAKRLKRIRKESRFMKGKD
jgi:hypothetical protein